MSIVNMCVKQKTIDEIKRKYPYAILIPIISDNKLPEALAQKIGMKMHTEVYKLEEQGRKNLSAMERLLFKPCFGGKIIKGNYYIIVDDIVTQGGTVSALNSSWRHCCGC